MDTKKVNKKQQKQDVIIILDEGINTKDVNAPSAWYCCVWSFYPLRIW